MINLNKSLTTTTFKHSLLAASITLILTACNSGSSSSDSAVSAPLTPSTPKTSLSGTVADGYLVNATVCLDLNENKKCDSDEPSTISNQGGTFTLSGVNQADIDTYPLVVEVIKNLTIDEDHPEQPIDGDYSLTAPAGYTFVSPLTTLVQQEIEANKDVEAYSVEDAEASVKIKLGTDLEMSTDYVAAQKNDSTVSVQEKEEFKQLHKVAQVTATVLKQNLKVVEQAVQTSGQSIDFEQIMDLVVAQVLDALEAINEQVENNAEELSEFDPQDILTGNNNSLSDDLSFDSETVVNKIEIREAEKAASSANMLELVQTEGVNWFYSGRHGSTLEAAHGTFKHIPATDNTPASSEETEYRYNASSNGFIEDTDSGSDDDYLLTSAGWEKIREQEEISINADGTISITNPNAPEYAELLEATTFDISGKNIALTLDGSADAGYWSEFVTQDAVFPDSAKAFKLKFTTLNDTYEIWNGDCDDPSYEVNGMCNSVWLNSANGPAEYLEQLLSETAAATTDPSQIKGPQVAWFNNGSIVAEMLIDGTVNYYEVKYNNSNNNYYSSTAEFLKIGTWQNKIVNGVKMFVLELPTKILGLGDYDYYERFILLTEYQGAVRRGEYIPAGTVEHDELAFNKSAADSIVAAFSDSLFDELVTEFNQDTSDGNETPDNSDPSTPQLETSLQPCTAGDSGWDDVNDRPTTFATKTDYDNVLASNCTTSLSFAADNMVGKTFIFSDEPTESIFFETDSKALFTSVADNGTAENNDISWSVNSEGQIELSIYSAEPVANPEIEFRAVLTLLESATNELSVKFYHEESEWYSGAVMDGTKGEIWSVILVEQGPKS
ncbi:hypothetical protein [Photobacterium lipolyticum]|uniref:Acid phosphatase n=1 Tax=Photobacterium lipolyticum TaxID=266810 RepID=A0A2T3N2E7_9GAMM|nr:hypothetical protein [Photobacterium lipolyticum]PSW06523.1 hypothetical protein C9I89_03025 [Photobacterium lipolyticum]